MLYVFNTCYGIEFLYNDALRVIQIALELLTFFFIVSINDID